MLTIIPLAVIIISFGTILVIAARHMRQAAALDITTLPEEREAVLKRSLLENRLLRRAGFLFSVGKQAVTPWQKIASRTFADLLKRVRTLERTYRFQTGLPDSNKKSDIKTREFLEKAKESLDAGNAERAEENFLSAIKLNPESLDAYLGLGGAYIKMQENDQARETLDYITKHWPQEDRAFAKLAELEESLGNLPEAKDYFLHALSLNNEAAYYHSGLADVYLRLNETEKALSSLQKAQAVEPNNPKILDQLLTVSVLLGNKPLAEEVLEIIKKVNPDHGKLDELEEKVKEIK